MLHKAKIWISISPSDLIDYDSEINEMLERMGISWLVIPVTNFPIFPIGTPVDITLESAEEQLETKITGYSTSSNGHVIDCKLGDMIDSHLEAIIGAAFQKTDLDALIYTKAIDFLG